MISYWLCSLRENILPDRVWWTLRIRLWWQGFQQDSATQAFPYIRGRIRRQWKCNLAISECAAHHAWRPVLMFFSLATARCGSAWCQGCDIAHSATRFSCWYLILFVPLILYIYSMHIVWVHVTSSRMSSSMHMASGCCLRDADIKTPMMHVPYLGGSLRANFNVKLFHASSRLVFSLHAQRVRSSLNFNYHSSSAMWALIMTVFFYVLQGILIIIIKTHDFILALLVARTHMARRVRP